jgi:DNA-binding NarL/FixJ family response regulator
MCHLVLKLQTMMDKPILVIVEDGINKFELKNILSEFKCEFISTGSLAFEFLQKKEIAMIIIDLTRFDHSSDIAFLQKIKTNLFPDLHVIGLSLNIDPKLNETYYTFGFSRILSKSSSLGILRIVVREFLNLKRTTI